MSRIDHDLEPTFTIGIGSDTPQTDPAFDEFGYAAFAKLIAGAVVKTPSPQGLVMAIHGSWGSGKSTLLNFVKHILSDETGDPEPVVMEFNPWWFEDRNQLASQFLGQFSTKLKLGPSKIRRAGDLMAEYSGALGKAVALSTGHAWIDVPVGALLKFFKLKPKDVPKLKGEIAQSLREGRQRYVCIVDDIDRLTPDEIREVFKVVKALADFPNVVYLLSFDRDVVAKALSASMKLNGEAYLEKIVQVPFSLPAIPKEKLHKKLFLQLDRLIEKTDLALFDQTYWGNIFVEGMAPLISKPRDIVRYVNALAITFPALRNEVNIADFFALEFLRVNLPNLYSTIRENPKWFAGRSDRGLQDGERKDELSFHQAWAKDLNESIRPGVQAMLARVFPRLDNMGRGTEFLSEWRRLRRAASPDVFPSYFAFAIDADQLSRQEIMTFIEGLEDKEKTQRTILAAIKAKRADGSSKAREYISRLLDFQDEIGPVRGANLLKVLGQIADQLILKSDETGGFFAVRSSWRTLWTFQHALSRIPTDERDAQLICAFEEGRSLTFLCSAIIAIMSTHEKPVEYGPAAVLTNIKPETVEKLKQLALLRIKEAAAGNTLISVPELPSVLIRWRDWGNPLEPRTWAESLLADKQVFVQFLTSFLSQTSSTVWGDAVGRTNHTMHLKLLADFIDLEKAAELLGQIGPDEKLDEQQRLAMSTFYRQYPSFKEGKDPDSPFAMMDAD